MKRILNNVFVVVLAFMLVFGAMPGYAAEEYRNLSMTPGRTASEMRFTWHSTSVTGSIQYRVKGASIWTTMNSTSRPHHPGAPGNYRVHQPIITGLLPNTTYEYRITWSGGQSDIKTFRTGGASEFSFIVVSDPQLASTAERLMWMDTMAVASIVFPEAQFVVSMGDQVASSVDWTVSRAQDNFNHLFAPPEFHHMPLAPIVGNHDSATTTFNPELWHFHYNTPTGADNVQNTHGVRRFTISGRPNPPTQFDYYFRYGNVLFIMLAFYDNDTTSNNAALTGRHNWLASVINANQDADWRVVAFHQPPYSANRPTGENSKQRIRTNWVPVFEQHNIDVAFAGHDHIYSRTHHMQGVGSGGTPGTPRLNQNWASQANNAVINPIGITYFSFGSPSGHSLRQPENMPRAYLARYHQANRREFSVVNVTPYTFSVATYMINGTGINGNSYTMTDIYTIVRANHPPGTSIPQFCHITHPVIHVECDYCGELVCVCPPVVFDMQTDPNWSIILHHANHPLMRGTGTPSGTASSINGPPRELIIPSRSGTSQGLRMRADVLLNALSDDESGVKIEYSGRLNVAGTSQIRIEQSPAPSWVQGVNVWTKPTDAGNVFAQTVTLTREQLQHAVTVGTGDITLGAVPANAVLTITGIRITEMIL